MRYYIVGYMYSGKTTFGRLLAKECGLRFLDLDQAFEQHYHYTVSRFFSTFGESAFRRLEAMMLTSTANDDDLVIATGGGTPCHDGGMDFILSHGRAIYLKLSPEEILQRALHSRAPRPAMRGLSADEMLNKIVSDLTLREPYYLRAHRVIDGLAPLVSDCI